MLFQHALTTSMHLIFLGIKEMRVLQHAFL